MYYTATDGVQTTVNQVKVRNVLVVSAEKDAEGSFQATVINDSAKPVTVSFASAEGSIGEVTVDPGQLHDLEADRLTIESVPVWPGELMPIQVSAAGESVDLDVPVLDGTLPEYRDLVPGGWTPAPEPTKDDHEEDHGGY
ncbi:MAG: hypothetical protein CSA58_07305 [Micrococcales bacterium]|nr:MAG: hypothetical protein CSB46_05850 [Micrococcales bacterium]PIE26852.1 MAG: hypothetical protein CSA58_07305 [Micrococcales bacterium]